MNLIKCAFAVIIALMLTILAGAQTATPEPTPRSRADEIEAEKALIEKETQLLKVRREYLEELKTATGTSTVNRDTSGGKTTFEKDDKSVFETVFLSYAALAEISSVVDERVKPQMAGYDRLVLYYEPDFQSLSRYRLYREQARQALENYAVFKNALEAAQLGDPKVRPKSVDGGGVLGIGLGIPSLTGSAFKSVAELISLFRTDRTISSAQNLVDTRSLNPVLAGTMLRSHPGLRVYNPEQFVPEYEIGIGDDQSFYETLSRIQMADVYLDLFLAKYKPEKSNSDDTLGMLIATARIIKGQINALTFAIKPDPVPVKPEEKVELTEFRNMVRAEKLDRFLKAGGPNKTGILLVRLLTSGGSRRESRNLILGTKNDYSGSAVIELALYDTDGTLRVSDVVSHHTGFKKFNKAAEPKP